MMDYEALQGMSVSEAVDALMASHTPFTYEEETYFVCGSLVVYGFEFEVEDDMVLYDYDFE